MKCLVTDFSLDHWLAQNYGLDILNFPENHQNPLWKNDRKLFKYFKEKYERGISYTPGSTPNAPELVLKEESSEDEKDEKNTLNEVRKSTTPNQSFI
mgnify:CR=1 FL=1